jgi:hypothetical protein
MGDYRDRHQASQARKHVRMMAREGADALMDWGEIVPTVQARKDALVWKYGNLPMCKTRSREAGNCKDGTEDWIQRYGLADVKHIDLAHVAAVAGWSRYAWRAVLWTALRTTDIAEKLVERAKERDSWFYANRWDAGNQATKWLDELVAEHKAATGVQA